MIKYSADYCDKVTKSPSVISFAQRKKKTPSFVGMASSGLALPGPPPVIADVDRTAICVEMVGIKKHATL